MEPTVKHRQFVANVLRGKTAPDAAVGAGFSADYGKALMKSPMVKGLLDEAMKKAGIDDYLIARKLREGLDAKAPPRKEGGAAYPDQFVRKQFLDVIFKLRGDYAPEKSESIHKTINLTIDRGMIEALRDTQFIDAEEVKLLEYEIVRQDGTNQEVKSGDQQEGPADADGRVSQEGMGKTGSNQRLEPVTS
jgi:phage terminase small subunit